MTQKKFAEMVGMPLISLKNYELERSASVRSENLLKITTHSQFQKYALWLVSDDFDNKVEQIAPPELKE